MSSQWHIEQDGKDHGPFTSSQLRKFATQGMIMPETLIRRETDTEWFPAARVKNLFSIQHPVSPQADEQTGPSEMFAAFDYSDTSNDRTTDDCVAEHLYSEPESTSDVSPFSLITPSLNESPQQMIPNVPLPNSVNTGSDRARKRVGGLAMNWQTTSGMLLVSTLAMLIVIAHESWAHRKFEQHVHESALSRYNFSKSVNAQFGMGSTRPLDEYIAEERAERNGYSWLNR